MEEFLERGNPGHERPKPRLYTVGRRVRAVSSGIHIPYYLIVTHYDCRVQYMLPLAFLPLFCFVVFLCLSKNTGSTPWFGINLVALFIVPVE